MAKAMVVSVGGSDDPVVFSLQEEKPEFVCFLVSQRSIDLVGRIKERAKLAFDDLKVLAEDPDDIVACYEKAVECLRRAKDKGYTPDEIVVDFTSGTKPMTAALAMAAFTSGSRFAYVSGRERDAGGLGRVRAGTENRVIRVNPGQLFAVEAKQRIAQHFNTFQFVAAAAALREASFHVRAEDRLLFEALALAAEGYALWDRFEHERALDVLARVQRAPGFPAPLATLDEFASVVAGGVRFLGLLKKSTAHFKRGDALSVADLLANAERRIDEGKFDDAVARLYRALELHGQIEFEHVFRCATSDATIEALPESLREEYASRYRAAGGKVQVPMFAAYRALADSGSDSGRRFVDSRSDIDKILTSRNSSILAHGLRPIGEEQAQRIREIACGFLPEAGDLPRFPKLPW